MHLKYMWLQQIICTRQAFTNNGTFQEWAESKWKTLCEIGMGYVRVGRGLYNRVFIFYGPGKQSIFGRKELRHKYFQFNKPTNQSDYSAIQLGSALHLINKHFWFYLFGFWHIININSVDSTFIKTSLIYICTVSKWLFFLFFSSL